MSTVSPDIDLDALIDRLQARAAERAAPLVNAAGDEVAALAAAGLVVVNPGDLITSQWGNLTFQQSMVVFANTADRNNMWPAVADGAICYTLDTGTAWIRRAGQWIQLNPPLPVGDAGWTNVATFTNGWTPNASFPPAYMLAGRIVYLRGVAASGTLGAVAFTLPAGYRPSAATSVHPCTNGAGAPALLQATVTSSGTVALAGTAGNFWLNAVSFPNA